MNIERKPSPLLEYRKHADEIAPEVPHGLQRTPPADDADSQDVASHPGLLALARILGRSAARADLRRTRRGAVAIMGITDAMLVVAAMIAITLVWSVILRLR